MSISQINATAVIDTGAEVTVMSSNYYEKLPEAVRPPLRPAIRGLVVAEAGRKMGSSGVADIEFEMSGNRYKWPMYVAPIRDDVLLGADFLDSFDATVSFSKGLSLGERSIECKVQRKGSNVHRIILDEAVTIPRKHEMILPGVVACEWTGDSCGLIEPQPEGQSDVIVGRTLVEAGGSVVPVSCANVSDAPMILPIGFVLGTLVPVVKVVPIDVEDRSHETVLRRVCSHSKYIDPSEIPYPEWDMSQVAWDGTDGDDSLLEDLPSLSGGVLDQSPDDVHSSSMEDFEPGTQIQALGMAVENESKPSTDPTTLMEEASQLPEHLHDLYTKSAANIPSAEDRGVLAELLDKYQAVFAKDKTDLGCCELVKHKINTGTSVPVRQPFRPTPKGFEGEELSHLKEQLDAGVVVPSKSPWASAVVLVRKKDQSVRWCVDYRRVNECSVKDAYPLPRTDMCLDCLSGAKLFSTLDLQSGYWQIKMDETDQEKTAFTTKYGLFEYTVMPFGLCNAPSTFQRTMELIFRGLQWQTLVIYLDDLIVFSPDDYAEHFRRLGSVLVRIGQAGLKLKPSKCDLLQREVLFLGHIVGQNGVQCNPDLIQKVKDWSEPTSVRQVQQFLGLCNYYRRFIYKYSDIAYPIVQLTRKGKEFDWSPECQRAFEALKAALCMAPVLSFPTETGLYTLDTDASDVGLGAVLSQEQDGNEKVIAYGSKTLSKEQRRYCTTRKELLAVVAFIKQFRHYLLGREFRVRTDHSSLRWLCNFKEPQGQLARWLEAMQQYNFTIEHRDGKKHQNADSLSRMPEHSEGICSRLPCGGCPYCEKRAREWETFHRDIDDVVPLSHVPLECRAVLTRATAKDAEASDPPTRFRWGPFLSHTVEELVRLQKEDPDLRVLHRWKDSQCPPQDEVAQFSPAVRSYYLNWENIVVEGGVLCQRPPQEASGTVKLQLLVPKVLRKTIQQHCHDNLFGGHLGVAKTLGKIHQRFSWYGMRLDVREHIRKCSVCGKAQKPSKPYQAGLGQYRVGYPLDRIGVDILGPLPLTSKGNKCVLVIGDYFTRWMEAYPLPDQTAGTVAHALVHRFIATFGCPLELHTDQGRNFESVLFQEVCRLLQISKTRATPYHPASNGLVERFNRTLSRMITSFIDKKPQHWDAYLPLLTPAYRSTIHPATGYTPNYLMFGREVTLPIDLLFPLPRGSAEMDETGYVQQLRGSREEAYRHARESLKRAAEVQKRDFDTKIKLHQYNLGDLVYRRNPAAKKFETAWVGPLVVTRRYSSRLYQIANKHRSSVLHHDLLKPYLSNSVPRWARVARQRVRVSTRPDAGETCWGWTAWAWLSTQFTLSTVHCKGLLRGGGC